MTKEERDSRLLREKRLVFYEQDVDRINRILEEFQKLAGTKGNILIDKDGHLITRVGVTESYDLPTVSALVAGSFAATREMARLLGEKEFSVLFHQGARDNIQLALIGDRTILATIFDNSTTIGMVRLYTKDAASKLEKIFNEIAGRKEEVFGGQELDASFGDQLKGKLDDFFGE